MTEQSAAPPTGAGPNGPRLLASDRPAGADRAVAIACDAAFHPYAAFLAVQLAEAHPERDFDIVIASDAPLPVPEVLSAAGVRHVALDAAGTFAGFPVDARRSLATYLWLALPEALGYRRTLALDADVFLARGEVGALLDVDMHGHAVAAVRDNKQWRTPGRRVKEFRALGWPAAPYFNAGVILVDGPAFARDRVFDRCAAFARDRLGTLGRDQALINCVLRGDWAELSPVWNWQYTWASSWLAGQADPNLVHFIGRGKPWRDAAGTLPLRYTAAYDAFLAAHFPAAERAVDLSRRRVAPARTARRALLRHWRTAAAMERYLARFPDDLTVREPA